MQVPLPTDSIEWPPPTWQADYDRIISARAKLTGTHKTGGTTARQKRGMVDRFRQRNQAAPDADRDTLHVPMPRQIARTSAALLFSEPPTLSIPEAHTELDIDADGAEIVTPEVAVARETEHRLGEIAFGVQLHAKLMHAAYVASGVGGVFLRPAWDRTLQSGRPLLTVVGLDRAIPVFRQDQLIEVTFWTELSTSMSGDVWRWLECHTAGKIEHALYLGRSGQLGQRHSILERPETKALIGPDGCDEAGIINLARFGIDGLLPDYVPNVLPHPVTLSGTIGGADTEGLEGQLNALDEADTGWRKDVRLGRRRIIVPDEFLQHGGRGEGSFFDDARDVFSPISVGTLDADAREITSVDFPVRSTDFQATVDNRMHRISVAAGYNAESVTWATTGQAVTATEILSRDALSADTTAAKRSHFGPAIAYTAHKLLQIDAALFTPGLAVLKPTVVWPEATEQDMRETANTLNLVTLAKAASTSEKVRMLHPDWTQRQIDIEVDKILAENSTQVADPFDGVP